MKGKILGLLGLCRRCRGLSIGFDDVVKKVKKRKTGLILVSNDFSCKSLHSIKEKLNNFDAQFIILEDITMEDLYSVFKKRTGVILVENSDFEDGLKKLIF